MKLFLFSVIVIMCMTIVGCTNQATNNPPQIAPMSLSAPQQEIVDLISRTGQEILLFEYSGTFTSMEVWVDVYHYGELVGTFAKLHKFGNSTESLTDGQLAIVIHNHNRDEFTWTMTSGGASVSSQTWVASNDHMARGFGPITEAVPIISGEEIILYVSRFTTGSALNTHGDLQYYLQNPEILAHYTYVHLIKARFSTN